MMFNLILLQAEGAAAGNQWSFWIMTIILILVIWAIIRATKKRSNQEQKKNVENRQDNIQYVSCPSCGAHNLPGSKYCSSCGKEMEQFCPKCGIRIMQGAKYCPKCGERL